MTVGTDLENDVRTACDAAFGRLSLDSERVHGAVVGGRRRRRVRRCLQAGGAVGTLAVLGVGAVSVSHGYGGPARPSLLGPAASPAGVRPAGGQLYGVTVGVLPAGYALAGSTPATVDAGLSCVRSAGADYLPAGEPVPPSLVGAEHLLQVTVTRGPVYFAHPAGGPAFGPTGLATLVTSPYHGPGARTGTFTTLAVRLGPQLVVTVQGTDLAAATVRSVAAGLVAGPADRTPAPASPPALPSSAGVHGAHC